MEKLKLIFIGTGEVGGPLLRALSADDRFLVTMAVTGLDKPAGRQMTLQPSPIKVIAQKLGLPVFQPDDINSGTSLDTLRGMGAHMTLLMAYGQILGESLLSLTPYGCLNVHASVLPKYRGASPIQAVLLKHEKETGVSLMKMVAKMDAGPVYADFKIPVSPDENQQTLTDKIALLCASQIPGALLNVFERNPIPLDQNEGLATYVKKISREDGQIDWRDSGQNIDAKIRAFYGWPGTFTFFRGKRFKIISATFSEEAPGGPPGIVSRRGIACGNGIIIPKELQMEGKNSQSLAGFLNGNPDFIGSRLG